MTRNEIIVLIVLSILFMATVAWNIHASAVFARTYCYPVDPDHIPFYAGTGERKLCPRTPTVQKPYCPGAY